MIESDWKVFKKIHKKAIERFCEKTFEELSEVINNKSEHVHDRYLLLYDLVQNKNKQMRYLFDGLSRNDAPLQLMAMRGKGLADEVLLSELSDEFLQATDPARTEW